jgi:transposase
MLMEADLPEDLEALRAFALEQSRKLADVMAAKGEADAEIERLQSIVDAFMRHRFGARSEQLDPDQLQLGLEDVETALGQARAARDAAIGKPNSDRPHKTNRGSLPAHLERIEQVVDVEEVDGIRACPCCGGALHQIGEDVAERLDVVPITFRVLVTRRPRYGCRSCESAIVQAPAPARIVEGGIPTEALIAQVLVAKYADHLPLYRQAQIYARQGIQLDRSTLADWVGRAAWYLRPLRDHNLERLRRSERLFADETTAPVLDPGRGRTKTGQLWAYARDDRPWGGDTPPMVAYVYAADRKGERAEAHLGDFAGILQVDGYGGYARPDCGRRPSHKMKAQFPKGDGRCDLAARQRSMGSPRTGKRETTGKPDADQVCSLSRPPKPFTPPAPYPAHRQSSRPQSRPAGQQGGRSAPSSAPECDPAVFR